MKSRVSAATSRVARRDARRDAPPGRRCASMGVVVQHLLEVRHQPARRSLYRCEAPAELVVHPAAAMRSRVEIDHRSACLVSGPRARRRSRNSSVIGAGNLGAPPKPPYCAVEAGRSRADRSVELATLRRRDVLAPPPAASAGASRKLPRLRRRPRRAGSGTLGHAPQHAREAGHAVPRSSGGKYVPPKNGLPVRRQEDGHRPAAAAGHRLHGAMYTSSRSGRSSRSTLIADEHARSSARRCRRSRTTRAP